MKFRDSMIETNDNLGWCAPLTITAHGKEITISVNEGKIVGCRIDGADCDNMDWEQIARLVNDEHENYHGWKADEIALDADWEYLPCCECPWFDICEAMDDDENWKEEHWDDDDWADYCGSEIDRDTAESMINDFLADHEDLGDDEYRDYTTGEEFKVVSELRFDRDAERWCIDCYSDCGDLTLYCDPDGNCRFH